MTKSKRRAAKFPAKRRAQQLPIIFLSLIGAKNVNANPPGKKKQKINSIGPGDAMRCDGTFDRGDAMRCDASESAGSSDAMQRRCPG